MSRQRVVALVDMDCFYAQVEQRLNPSYLGKPCAVVQYNSWKGGGIIAVSYEARKFGVTRCMRGDEAKKKCPEIILASVPESRGKADLTRYRDAGAEVMAVLQTFADICERASVDEAYLDLTDRVQKELEKITLEELVDKTLACSHIIGYTDSQSATDNHDVRGQWLAALSDEHNKCLAMGALIAQQAREAIREKTGFTSTAGIAHNKVLAKIAGGSHKPNQQTLLPHHSVAKFFETTQIKKVRFFGGKFGQSVINSLHVEYMSELTKYSQEELQRYFGEKSGMWLYDVCRGREYEIVRPRNLAKSCGCGKNFPGKSKLISKEKVRYWMLQLASELSDRLKTEQERNHRTAKLVSVGLSTETSTSVMRSFPLRYSDPESLCDNAMQVIKTFNSATSDKWQPGITCLSINASKFEDISKSSGTSSITSFFAKKENVDSEKSKTTETIETSRPDNGLAKKVDSEIRTPSNPNVTLVDNLESTDLCYLPDEIDLAIMNELPGDIRNEIEQFHGISKIPERSKRTSNGIEKYTISRNADAITKKENDDSLTENTTSGLKTSDIAGFLFCAKCGQQVAESKMDEHNDFHFAMELQNRGEITPDGLQAEEPPKKRKRGTISTFFTSKNR